MPGLAVGFVAPRPLPAHLQTLTSGIESKSLGSPLSLSLSLGASVRSSSFLFLIPEPCKVICDLLWKAFHNLPWNGSTPALTTASTVHSN